MNDREMCGNENALISYLYDEGDQADREAMAAHVVRCTSCAYEIEALRLTRSRLSAWTPPAAALGFRITREEPSLSTPVLTSPRQGTAPSRSGSWWTRPLPAWAQAAAAIVIFAGGMLVGSSRGSADDSAAVSGLTGASRQAASVSREDFDRLQAEVTALRRAPAGAMRVTGSGDGDPVLQQAEVLVNQRVAASEARQRRELDRQIAGLVADFDAIRVADLKRVSNSVSGLEAATGQRFLEHQNAISQWNQIVGNGRVVPTSVVR